MAAYYNEFDPYAAQWLRNLISKGLIAPGEVDERSIKDVKPDEIKNFTQVHLFAGSGGWSIATKESGWPVDEQIWTGSPPCQPFSVVGKKNGAQDERDLWPEMFRLVRECRPDTVFIEQVDEAIEFGWLDRVFDDMEGEDYQVGPFVLPACSVGSPQKRNRLYAVANAISRNKQQTIARSNKRKIQASHWANYERLDTGNGRAIRIKPGIRLLEDGVRHRTSKLRAYGNAIVPQVAAEFIRACMSANH